MLDYQTNGCGPRGADMGRPSDLSTDTTAQLTIRRVPLDNGGYDPGGAYWGTPNDLFFVADDEGHVFYTRAADLDTVKAMFPHATWLDNPAAPTEEDVDDMFLGYVEAALWSTNDESTEDGGVPLDDNYSEADLSDDCRRKMRADCDKFAADNAATLRNVIGKMGPYGRKECSWSSVGHDFWLTRNRHGCGFWDGDYPEPEDKALTDASKKLGEVNLYVEDGKVITD